MKKHSKETVSSLKQFMGTPLMVQWLKLRVPNAVTSVWSLVRELDPTGHKDLTYHNEALAQPNKWVNNSKNIIP